MANVIYPLAKQRLIDWILNNDGPAGSADLCVIGVKATYTYNAGHSTLANVSGASIVVPERELQNVTTDLGVVDADDVDLTGMSVGETIDAFIVYFKWASATLLLAYMDTPTNSSIPQTINSPAGLLTFDPAGIFRI